jgi:hypothetical protein
MRSKALAEDCLVIATARNEAGSNLVITELFHFVTMAKFYNPLKDKYLLS